MGISKYNSNVTSWEVDNKDFTFVKLRELQPEKDYPLLGMFISKDNGYGEGAVLIIPDYNVNIPQRYVSTIEDMMKDPEVVELINSGKCAFHYTTFYSDKYHREGYRIDFVDKI